MSNNVKQALDSLRKAVAEAHDEFDESIDDSIDNLEDELMSAQPSKAAAEKVLQGRIRNGVLHLQYGSHRDYQRADLQVTEAQKDYIFGFGNSNNDLLGYSFAGTTSKYLRGAVSGSYISLGGFTFTNPFKAEQPTLAPVVPKSYNWE